MTDMILRWGYLGLFVASFLSSSFLPLASDLVTTIMPTMGFNYWLVILTATAGGFLGNLTNYYIGWKGRDYVIRWLKVKPTTWDRAEAFYQKWGPAALFFSWLPLIGDPMTAIAGTFRVRLRVFTFYVVTGKILRYVVFLSGFAWLYELLG